MTSPSNASGFHHPYNILVSTNYEPPHYAVTLSLWLALCTQTPSVCIQPLYEPKVGPLKQYRNVRGSIPGSSQVCSGAHKPSVKWRSRVLPSKNAADHLVLLLRIRGAISPLRGGLISLWLYKENNKLRDWKKCIYSTYSPLSSTHLWLRCSNFFNPSKKDSFPCAANRKIGKAKDLSAALSAYVST
jgi:hypothetical protein